MSSFNALRFNVLRLGMSGCLVPQLDCESEVEQIGLTPDQDTEPLAIPPKWKWVQIKDLGHIVTGITPSKKEENWVNPNIVWITASDLHANQGLYISEGARAITQKGLDECWGKLAPIGSVLYTIAGWNIGDIAIAARECSVNSSCAAFVPDCKLIGSKWAYYCLMYATSSIRSKVVGTAITRITKEIFGQTLIPLPPLKEQQRIVAKLDDYFRCIDLIAASYNEVKGPLTAQMRSILLQMAFSGELVPQLECEPRVQINCSSLPQEEVPFPVPEKWQLVRLGDVLDAKSGCSYSTKESGNAKILRIVDLMQDEICWDKVRFCKATDVRIARSSIHEGDIVIAAYGDNCIGKSCVVRKLDEFWPCLPSSSLLRLRLKPNIPIDVNYVRQFFNSNFFKRKIMMVAQGSANISINKDLVKAVPFPLPPLEEQHRIVARLEELLAAVDHIKDAFSFSNLLAPETPPKLPEQALEPKSQVQSADIASEPETQSVTLKPEAVVTTPETTTLKLEPEAALEPKSSPLDIEPELETKPAPLKSEAAASTEVSPRKQPQPKSKPRQNKAHPATQLSLLDQIEARNDWS